MTSRFVQLPQARVHYLQAGHQGAPLVLLHGTALDSSCLTYGLLIPKLARHFQVFALDWPGYGDSDKPPLEYTADFYDEVLKEFLEALGLARPHIAAFSMGGAAALRFALEQPDALDKLILISSYGLGATLPLPVLPRLALRLPGGARFFWRKLKTNRYLLPLILRYGVLGRAHALSPDLVLEVRRQLDREGLEFAVTNWLSHELGHVRLHTNYRPNLARLTRPTLLLHGTSDRIIPAYRSRRAARLIPDAQLRLLPGCGHWSPREAPEAVLANILTFLGGVGHLASARGS